MLLKERKYKKCATCDQTTSLIQDEVYGCDECLKEIDMNDPESNYLDAAIFHHKDRNESKHYCSWKCALTNLRKVKTDYFIKLPFLNFDSTKKGLRPQDFFALMK